MHAHAVTEPLTVRLRRQEVGFGYSELSRCHLFLSFKEHGVLVSSADFVKVRAAVERFNT